MLQSFVGLLSVWLVGVLQLLGLSMIPCGSVRVVFCWSLQIMAISFVGCRFWRRLPCCWCADFLFVGIQQTTILELHNIRDRCILAWLSETAAVP